MIVGNNKKRNSFLCHVKFEFVLKVMGVRNFVLFCFTLVTLNLFGQRFERELNWKGVVKEQLTEEHSLSYLYFESAQIDPKSKLPHFSEILPLSYDPQNLKVEVEVKRSEPLSSVEKSLIPKVEFNKLNYQVVYLRGKAYLSIGYVPLTRNSKETQVSFIVKASGQNRVRKNAARGFSSNSVLADGTWFKLGVTQTGMYRLTYDFLRSIGVDLNNVSSNEIALFGNGGYELPRRNSEYRPDDLLENPVRVVDGGDGRLDEGDYILFYGREPHTWVKEASSYRYRRNPYSDTSYYFLTFDASSKSNLKVGSRSSLSNPSKSLTVFDHLDVHEIDRENLLKSGRIWFGENFSVTDQQTVEFEVPNISTSQKARLYGRFAIRTVNGTSRMQVSVRGLGASDTLSDNGGVSGVYYDTYAKLRNTEFEFSPTGEDIVVDCNFSKGNSEANAWIDRIEIQAKRNLRMEGNVMTFRNADYNPGERIEYRLSSVNAALRIWDVTDVSQIREQQYQLQGNTAVFVVEQDTLKEFIAFYDRQLTSPSFVAKMQNQNLHAAVSSYPDLIIVTPKSLSSHAEDLANFRRDADTLDVLVVDAGEIYHEFGGGNADPTAIKDFVRMFYESAGGDHEKRPRYLLLFGDASYDYKDRIGGNTNLIPTFESEQSLEVILSYASDDYFGLLDPFEADGEREVIDIGIGRLPIKNAEEARKAVSKLKRYYSPRSLGPWRNEICFIGDDGDGRLHMEQADSLANILDTLYKDFNIRRIFFDAYKQYATPGGARYPDVNEAINEQMRKGSLVLSYVGHGGELGWAHERVLEVADINAWTNAYKMPLFVTATCEFSRYDDPQRTSAGEFVFLNPDGGGIGLVTTTRLVYSTPNFRLGIDFNNLAYKPLSNGEMPRLGDLALETKARNSSFGTNTRVFLLLGDPSMRLSYPKMKILTTTAPDTIRALDKVRIEGYVSDVSGVIQENFNGVVFPTVYDKKRLIETLNNDGEGAFSYLDRSSVIFKGKASVKNGKFSFEFIAPKDISKIYGRGKISYYATSDDLDAAGYYDSLVVGGINVNAPEDNKGPEVSLFMNDENFVSGGVTNESPELYSKLFDQNGINTAGTGVGHDIVAILDANTADAIVLNDYYESDLNSYQSGSIRYPFNKLKKGEHTLSLKAWDVYNNSGETNISFIVAESEDLALYNVLNYPNPFTTRTEFYFEHNFPGQDLQIRIQIFTVSGKLVKTIDGFHNTQGFRVGPITWNARDEYGDRLARGVYMYKVQVKAPNGETADQFEKLVVLN